MIIYKQYEEKYETQIYNLIYNIMLNELEFNENLILKITSDLKNIRSIYIEKGGNFWIALDTEMDEVIGTVAILKIDESNAEFKRFYVKKEYRNEQIGFNLYKIAEGYATINNIKKLYLVSGSKSIKAQQMYYKNGWKLVEKRENATNINIREGANLYKKILTSGNT